MYIFFFNLSDERLFSRYNFVNYNIILWLRKLQKVATGKQDWISPSSEIQITAPLSVHGTELPYSISQVNQ